MSNVPLQHTPKPVEIYIHDKDGQVLVSYYRLPLGRMVYRNTPEGKDDTIDFTRLRDHVGENVVVYRNGSLEGTVKLAAIEEIDGYSALIFEPELDIGAIK